MVMRKDEAVALNALEKAIDNSLVTFSGTPIAVTVPTNITDERLHWLIDRYTKSGWKVDKRVGRDHGDSYWTLYFE